MAIPLEQFVKQLEDSRILTDETIKEFIPPKASPKDGEELARELVRRKQLTKFQAEEIYRGKGKSLVLGNYVLLEKIGQGGMGAVFKAQHRRMKRVVALKMLPSSMWKDAAAAARFQREVEAAAKLRHPNIIAADDADEANGIHFLVMEYVEGSDLSALVKKNGPLSVGQAVNYILQAARGLEAAHAKGIVHRDIKPANLLLDNAGTVKILDMGLARVEQGNGPAQAELTTSGTIMGTVDYMAPEQALNIRTADARADIYSLGCSLYYLLAGKVLYDGDTFMLKLLAHREQPIPSLQDVQANVPNPLEAIFKTMVAKKADDRYQTISEVVKALEGLGFAGSGSSSRSEVATTILLSSEERKKLSQAGSSKVIPGTLASLTEVVTHEKSKHLFAKIMGGTFATIIAPILVTYLIKYLEKDDPAPKPAPETAAAATAPLAVAATNTTLRPTAPAALVVDQSVNSWNTPEFQQWLKGAQALSGRKQADAVSKKLIELNPGFDGTLKCSDWRSPPKIESGVVTDVFFITDNVDDISPIKAFIGLRTLWCRGSNKPGKLYDLTPLNGMKISDLDIQLNEIVDLTPLTGMPLEKLHCYNNPIKELSPLRNMPLKDLHLVSTPVTDLSPLKGMPLEQLKLSPGVEDISVLKGMPLQHLNLDLSQVTDLSPLQGMRLISFGCTQTRVSDLSPLKGMPLTALDCFDSLISDLSPLEGMKLTRLFFTPKAITKGIDVIRQMKTFETIGVNPYNPIPVEEFWKKYDAGEFGNPILPAWQGYREDAPKPAVVPFDAEQAKKHQEEWAKYLKVPVEYTNSLGMKFRLIPPGKFTMGSSQEEIDAALKLIRASWGERYLQQDRLQHDVVITQGFYLGETEVTFGQFRQFVDEAKYNVGDDRWTNPGREQTDNHPVVWENWNDAVAFCLWLSEKEGEKYRLPTEAQWEYSCRAGTKTWFSFGDNDGEIQRYAWISTNSQSKVQPVKGLLPNPWDLRDMHGNVLEWCQDHDPNYEKISPSEDPPSPPAAGMLARRGGSYRLAPVHCRSAFPQHAPPGHRSEEVGFRVLLTVDAVKQDGSNGPWDTPAFQLWMKDTQALSGKKQMEAVVKKLQELNPGFDGKVLRSNWQGPPKIENGVVTELLFVTDNITDISPVRALVGLRELACQGSGGGKGKLNDLSPIKGMKLSYLLIQQNNVDDLSPLTGMPLEKLYCYTNPIKDLSPLRNMPLKDLHLAITEVADISPLKGMKLNQLSFSGTQVNDISVLKGMPMRHLVIDGSRVVDLSPLQGMSLTEFNCGLTQVSDLSPLKGMPLTILQCNDSLVADLSALEGLPLTGLACNDSLVTDLSALEGMKLTHLFLTPNAITNGIDTFRQMKTLETMGVKFLNPSLHFPAKEFWKRYDAGEFGKPTL